MATELSRRAFLGAGLGAGVAAVSAAQATPAAPKLWAAWDTLNEAGAAHRVGLLRLGTATASVLATLAVPTRAHGLVLTGDGALIAVARRPGDWLLRWPPGARAAQWHWNDAGRVFNGHARVRGQHLYTTETDLESGQGMVVLRDALTLRELDAWPTLGRDPHDLLFDHHGGLWVANGGIGTDAATGRSKDTRAMDSSLVCLDAASGTLRGRWRLDDDKLSLRHLALGDDGRIGVALQAEHEGAAERERAPLLAVWHGGRLTAIAAPPAGGYAGDIALHAGAFVVSATRAGRLLAWGERGWAGAALPAMPCALATHRGRLWCGQARGLAAFEAVHDQATPATLVLPGLRLDNHALAA